MDELVRRIGALRSELEQLEAALGRLPVVDTLPVLELDGEGRIQQVSAGAAVRLDATGGDLVGRRFDEAFQCEGDGADAVVSLDGCGIRSVALRCPGRDGELVVLGPAGSTLPGTSSPRTSRKLVHDIANILGIIRGHAELAAMQHPEPRLESSMQEIVEAVRRAQAMLEAER